MISLTSEQKKQLKILEYQIKSYGGDSAHLQVYVYDGGDLDFASDFKVKNAPHYIELNDTLRDLFEEIFNDEIESEFGYESSGFVDFNVDAEDSTLEIVVNINTMVTNYSSEEYDFDQLISRNEAFKGFIEENKKYGSGTVSYEGGGDSGYIEDYMVTSSDTVNLSEDITDTLYGILNTFGGWEINEGSTGNFYFDFNKEIMIHEHGENYQDSESNTFETIKF